MYAVLQSQVQTRERYLTLVFPSPLLKHLNSKQHKFTFIKYLIKSSASWSNFLLYFLKIMKDCYDSVWSYYHFWPVLAGKPSIGPGAWGLRQLKSSPVPSVERILPFTQKILFYLSRKSPGQQTGSWEKIE